MVFTAAEIAKELGGEVFGDGSVGLSGFAPASNAKAGDLTFAENATFFTQADQTAASAILVDKEFTSSRKAVIRVASARIASARILAMFYPEPKATPGVHPCAIVSASAEIDPSASVGPHCVIGDRVKLGPGVVLDGGNHIGADCQVGDESRLFPKVTLYPKTQVGRRVRIHAGTVIGSDGFGYVWDTSFHRKIPQIGSVLIHDDVEIGANVTIDRGALGPTVIGRGTKIDNLVQIAHNVNIGEHCLIVAQVGIAGSTKLGAGVTLAGQVGVAGHLKIGNRVTVAAQSGVMHEIGDGQKWFGSPAQPDHTMKRQLLALKRLPELARRLAEVERHLGPLPPEAEAPKSTPPHDA